MLSPYENYHDWVTHNRTCIHVKSPLLIFIAVIPEKEIFNHDQKYL